LPQFEEIQTQIGEIYQEINQKMAEFEQILNENRADIETKVNMESLNEMLNTKANKPTVAQALHRKANKGEVEEILSQKVNIEDLKRIMDQLNEKANIADLHHLQSIIESKTDRNELKEILQTHSTPEKQSVDKSLFDTLARERDLCGNKIENIELQLKSHILKIDSELKTIIDSFNAGLSKKADFRDLEGIGNNIYNKIDTETVSEMIGEVKEEILERIRKNRDGEATQRKDLTEEMLERYNKQNQKIEKCIKNMKNFSNKNDVNGEMRTIKSDVKEIIFKEVDLISSKVRDEINKAIDELHTSRIKIDHEISQRVRK